MRYNFVVAFLFIFSFVTFANQPVKVSTEYVYYAPETMSVEEAKRTAIERAKIQAIEQEFGTKIAQSASTIIASDNQNSNIYFSSHGTSDVKGEWLETIGQPEVTVEFKEHGILVTCRIVGMAKESSSSKMEFDAETLRNLPNLNCASTQFYDGDDMFLYFKAPISGFLTVFLLCDDDNQAYCLLPYKRSKGIFPVVADKEYYLFSKEFGGEEPSFVDEYTLTASKEVEYNEIVVIFSPSEYTKTGLSNSDTAVPKKTSIKKFNEWISKLKAHNDYITTKNIYLKITSK